MIDTERSGKCANPKCRGGSVVDDFCSACGEYAAWREKAAEDPAAPEPIDQVPAQAVAMRPTKAPARNLGMHPTEPHATVGEGQTTVAERRAIVGLTVQAAEDGEGERQALDVLRVAAGATLTLVATVRNESERDYSFTVELDGLPKEWVTVSGARSYLAPAQSPEPSERDVTIEISPPRRSASTIERRDFSIVAFPDGMPDAKAARVDGAISVEPFEDLALEVKPKTASGRRSGTFQCRARNLGNVMTTVTVAASDAAQACWLDLPGTITIEAGKATPANVVARPVRTLWVGRPIDHRIQVQLCPPHTPDATSPTPLVYRQLPWIAWWAPTLLILLAGIAIALYALLPRTLTMPALIGEPSAFAAQRTLAAAGWHGLPAIQTEISPRVAAGSVVGQIPQAGSVVERSVAVTLQVATAPATAIVPYLIGLTATQATTVLTRVHLKLGEVSPRLQPKARISGQAPAAGVAATQESAVSIVLAPRTTKVPSVSGLSVPRAEKSIVKAGLSVGTVNPPLGPSATVAGQAPSPGVSVTLGSRVNIAPVPPKVRVPSIVGLRISQAGGTLEACGLRLASPPAQVREDQVVAEQTPAAQTLQPRGSAVMAILAEGSAKEPGGGKGTPPSPSATTKGCPAR